MAATDQPYRSQKSLDIVFAVSSVLMLLSMVWMFAEDYNREYKAEQRQFRDVVTAMAQRGALEQMPSLKEFRAKKAAVVKAKQDLESNRDAIRDLRSEAAKLQPTREKLDAQYQNLKAELDSVRSFYDLAVEEHGADSDLARKYRTEVARLQEQVEAKLSERDSVVEQIKSYRARADGKEQGLLKAQAELNKVTEKFDAQVKLAIQKQWRFGDWVRNLPVIDAFAAPVKIQQVTLTDLPIDYNFKYVTRFDRCMTCHQGIDKNGYTREGLRKLKETTPAQDKKLEEAQTILEQRREALEGLPEQNNVPTPDQLRLTPVNLTEGQVNEFCVHPRLDLFVGGDSKHPAEKFGCTTCHGGQGSATSFTLASHSPNDPEQKQRWQRDHGWEHNEFWDFPMLPMRFVESSCLRCHHQVTDLISSDNKNEAPKVLRGYNLIKENGCFGCHEIGGRKDGREVGPDLRLEGNPPLESLSPAERARILADPDNAPGNLRKVGPSLYRVSEKSNEEWAARWLRAPRAFRPDTKMPHFYGLSNNNPHKLSDELDGPSQLGQPRDNMTAEEKAFAKKQKDFPDAEVRSAIAYIFQASRDYLDGSARKQDQADVERLTKVKAKAELNSEQQKLLAEAQERLAQPVPAKLAEPPEGKADPARGRKLFSERGCLACHHHDATDREAGELPAIPSDAQFGPNLSQVKAKLGAGKGNDDPQARRWLVNWILDPHVHSPRSRMPVTHLTPAEAADVAAWLLDQEPTDLGPMWKTLKVAQPTTDTMKALARVYLIRNLAPYEIEKFFKGELVELDKNKKARLNERGELVGRLGDLPVEERELGRKIAEAGGKVSSHDLMMYLGKRAVGRLGCFGCHDIPGFDHAKVIGVNLQDWGKKDPARLAFEDSKHFVEDNFFFVDRPVDDKGKPHGPKKVEGRRKLPYERFFAEALFHRTREGFLNLKIRDPRSYDYNGIRAWDDMSRMPQFKFARLRRKPGESDSAFEARSLKAEDEAREAVMTFILGLVAEPIPGPYVNRPSGDRLAEVKGRQILDKFNCAGCHLIRPGVYDFRLTPTSRDELKKALERAKSGYEADYDFLSHHYWAGTTPSQHADTLRAHAVSPMLTKSPGSRAKVLYVTLTAALRFPDPRGEIRDAKGNTYSDIRSSSSLALRPSDLVYPSPGAIRPVPRQANPDADAKLVEFDDGAGEFGGTFARLLTEYLMAVNPKDYGSDAYPLNENGTARASVPPSLIGEGERAQPDWLFQFLLNPTPVRKMTVLRMPRFNMSEDEAQALVAYFAGVERIINPGTELPFPQALIPQQQGLDSAFWRDKTSAYVARLKEAKVMGPGGKETTLYEKRLEELRPVWQHMLEDSKARAADAERQVKAARARVDEAKAAADKAEGDAKKAAEAAALEAERVLATWQDELKRYQDLAKGSGAKALQQQWEEKEAYVTDAFRLLTDRTLCSNCHQVGILAPSGEPSKQGPPLALAARRLRPGWLKRWVALPQRSLPYPSVMPQNFPANKPADFQELFAVAPLERGAPLQRIEAIRDVLMIFPQAQEMPLNRQLLLPVLTSGPPAGNTKTGDTKTGSKKKGDGK
jgi:cytochrome c2